MYRRRNGSLSFSFGRLVTNAFPNFASSSAGYIELTPQRQDMFYSYQLSTPNPILLGTNVFYVAGCTDHERRSTQIHTALQKNGVLDEEGRVNTRAIGPKFIHQLAFVDQMSQKNVVNLLFFWEEEVHRLTKLDKEEEELTSLIQAAEKEQADEQQQDGDHAHTPGTTNTEALDQMKFARERVRMKKRQRPTQRRPDMETDQDTTVQDAFKARVNAPAYTKGTASDPQPTDVPPDYYGAQAQNLGRHRSVA